MSVLIAAPTLDKPDKADVVLVLGPPMVQRLVKAERIIDEGIADHMIVSVPPSAFHDSDHTKLRDLCRGLSPYQVTCLTPDPFTTQGEARLAKELMSEHGWNSIVVITSVTHVSRARMLFDRCLDDSGRRSYFVTDERKYDGNLWASELIYQSAAWVKAAFGTGC